MSTSVLVDMPDWLDRRHAELNRAACLCYELRNDAQRIAEDVLAADLEATGDVYLLRARALTAEWES